MAQAENKTKQNDASVDDFLEAITDEQKREDALAVCKMMQEITGLPPKMWGSSIVGFGTSHYKYASGREGDTMMIGFSPRKNALTFFLMDSYEFAPHQELMKKLGKYKTGKSCLYINRLSDVDTDILRKLVAGSYGRVKSGRFLES